MKLYDCPLTHSGPTCQICKEHREGAETIPGGKVTETLLNHWLDGDEAALKEYSNNLSIANRRQRDMHRQHDEESVKASIATAIAKRAVQSTERRIYSYIKARAEVIKTKHCSCTSEDKTHKEFDGILYHDELKGVYFK